MCWHAFLLTVCVQSGYLRYSSLPWCGLNDLLVKKRCLWKFQNFLQSGHPHPQPYNSISFCFFVFFKLWPYDCLPCSITVSWLAVNRKLELTQRRKGTSSFPPCHLRFLSARQDDAEVVQLDRLLIMWSKLKRSRKWGICCHCFLSTAFLPSGTRDPTGEDLKDTGGNRLYNAALKNQP